MHPEDDDRLQQAFEALPEGHRPRALDEAVLARATKARARRPAAPWLATAACAVLAAWMIWPLWRPADELALDAGRTAPSGSTAAPEAMAELMPMAANQGGGGEPRNAVPTLMAEPPFAADAAELILDAAPRARSVTETQTAASAAIAETDAPTVARAKSASMTAAMAGQAIAPQPATAADWWQKIEALLAADDPLAAQAALASLRRQHPDFDRPSPFPESLDWRAAAPDE